MRIIDAVDDALRRPIWRCSAGDLSSFVERLGKDDMEKILARIILAYRDGPEVQAGAVAMDTSTGPVDRDALKSLLIYAESVIIPDPLLDHPLALRQIIPSGWCSLDYPHPREQLQSMLLEALLFHKSFRDAIRSGLVVPSKHGAVASARQHLDHFFGEGGATSDAVMGLTDTSIEIQQVVEAAAMVRACTVTGRRMRLREDIDPRRSSKLAILLKGDPRSARARFERHMNIEILNRDERLVRMVEGPCPSEKSYQAWVGSCLRKLASNRSVSLQSDLLYASACRGSLVTTSSLNRRLIQLLDPDHRPGPESIAAQLDLPALSGVDFDAIVRARADEDLFRQFQSGFAQACRSAGGGKFDPDGVAEVQRDFIEGGIRTLRRKYRALRAKAVSDLVLTTVSISVSAYFASLGLVAWIPGILGAMNELKSVGSHVHDALELKGEPTYLLWDLTRRPFSA